MTEEVVLEVVRKGRILWGCWEKEDVYRSGGSKKTFLEMIRLEVVKDVRYSWSYRGKDKFLNAKRKADVYNW